MIDKSIRQHYQEGKKVNPFRKGIEMLVPKVREKITPTSIAKSAIQRGITKKLAGTGLLSSLGPIGTLLAMFLTRKGIDYAGRKMPKDIQQALTQGFTGLGVASPEAQKELRQLENRRQYMLQRKAEGKNYSEKNLDIVTRAIAEAKGLDINNPNEMKNIDKPITQIRTEKSITEPPQVIPKTPEVIIPHLGGDDIIPTPTTVTRDVGLGDAGIAERIAAENRAAATQAAAIKAENDRQQREADAAAAAAARAAAAPVYSAPARPHGGGNGGGSQSSAGGYSRGDYGGRGHHWAKGGRVDKALGGRVRDI